MNIFVTGTNSGVGKTLISAGLATIMQSLGYTSAVYKPIQTGAKEKQTFLQAPDLAFVKQIDQFLATYCTYLLKSDAVPAIGAEYARTTIDLTKIQKDYKKIAKSVDTVLVEGVGGLMTPVTGRLTIGDIALSLKLPTIIVVNVEGDFINRTLMTLKTAELYPLEILGIVLNKYSPNSYFFC